MIKGKMFIGQNRPVRTDQFNGKIIIQNAFFIPFFLFNYAMTNLVKPYAIKRIMQYNGIEYNARHSLAQ